MKRKTAPNPEERKLKEIVEESKNILISAQAVFPFQLFPTRITLDRHKLTIVHRSFFWAEQTVSVPIEDIKNIQADIGPIFGSVTITSPLFINNEQKVDCLHREDARCIQKLVQGATVALKEKIDLSKVETSELNKLLMDLGEGHTV
ncbi:MAG TPA: hypothetical protein VGS08_06195 [Candidatus Saccharimonadales bacterium]|nr:hypothetical protein [Candidatus Saccharimonadales bacterium]